MMEVVYYDHPDRVWYVEWPEGMTNTGASYLAALYIPSSDKVLATRMATQLRAIALGRPVGRGGK